MPAEQSPTGPTRRRRRLSDRETERRMLDAALETVNQVGLTVSLEHISLEDVIRDAGVSRSAVYRRWPYKDLFFSDLVRELAKAASPAAVPDRETAVEAIRAVALQRLDELTTPAGRYALIVDLLRLGNLQDLESFGTSAAWRTFVALQATYLSLEDDELREDVRAALAESERALVRRTAGTLRYFVELFGYRLRPGLEMTYEQLVAFGMPILRGAIIMAPTTPEVLTQREQPNPFGVEGSAAWSPVAVAMTSVVLTYVEPDPGIEWDDDRLERVRRELGG